MIWSIALLLACAIPAFAADPPKVDYRVLATSRTSTMEKEMNEAASAGYVFHAVMGGESAFGGKEVIVAMGRQDAGPAGRRTYKLLATSRTSTMEKELRQAGAEGFEYRGQTVFESAFGGREVAVILERAEGKGRFDYRVLATSRTSTMQKELGEAGQAGFSLLGMTVAKTGFGGNEVLCIMGKTAAE